LVKVVREAPVFGGGALIKIGHCLSRVKICGRPPFVPKYGIPKNVLWMGQNERLTLSS